VALSGSTPVTISATTTFTVVAISATGATATQSATATVTSAPTPAPTAAITATMQNATTALVTWQTTNAVSALINGTAVPLSGSAPVTISATTTFTLVATSTSGAAATRSATATVAPPTSSTPSPATNMGATVSGARATLSWRAPTTGAAPDRYLLYVGSSTGGTNLANAFVVGNVLTVAGDLPRGRYYARVRAANSSGASAESNEVFFKIGRTLVSPRGFTVTWVGTTAVLTWTAPAADGAMEDRPTSYVIEAGTAPGASDVATVAVGNVTTIQADIPSGTYYVRVRAVNDYGDSEPTTDLVLVAPGAPGAPTNLASPGSGSTVTLQWRAPSGAAATAYSIEVGSAPGRSDLGVLQVGNVTQVSAPAPPPGIYYVRVRAINGRGAGQPSNEVIVRR
jgi:predicted phage tail protein